MVNRRIRMGKIKEIIRLYEAGLSIRKIAQALAVSRPVVSQYIIDYKKSGLKYKNIANISDTKLLELLSKKKKESQKYKELAVNFDYYTKELKKKGVTLHILWEEYIQKHPDGYKYTQFCYHYQIWRQLDNVTMHIEHNTKSFKLLKMLIESHGKPILIVEAYAILDPDDKHQSEHIDEKKETISNLIKDLRKKLKITKDKSPTVKFSVSGKEIFLTANITKKN